MVARVKMVSTVIPVTAREDIPEVTVKQNGGSCVDGLHNYSCKCPVGYTGSNCITEISSTATTLASPTSSATRGTSSVQPTTRQPETKFVVELRFQWTWNDDLENENSEAFKELSQILVMQISKQYSYEDNFVRVEMLSFRPGSVLAQFQLLFKNKIGDERALTPLKKAVQDGKLGSLTVDPESLKMMKDIEEPTKEDKGKVPYPLILGASCGGVFFLAILIIYLIRYCHRRKMASSKRVLGVMPGERAFSNSKEYELQEIKSEEDHARYEEIGMWKDNVSYKEIPISQDAARYEKLKLSNSAIYQELQDTPNVDCDYEEIHTSNDALRNQGTSLLPGPSRRLAPVIKCRPSVFSTLHC